MKIENMQDLFVHELKDLHGAEKSLTKALGKMAKAASHEALRQAFEEHRDETQSQMERLEKIFEEMNVSPRGSKCPGIEGCIEEATDLIDKVKQPDVLDTALIGAAQRVEHYEIAAYGCLRALAEQLGKHDVAEQLQGILDEEKRANEKLNELALSQINEEAMAHAGTGGNGMQH